ncbi:MAG TPA: roadblock/LC7 domain-containing protein [Pseudonocardiaceae bacterium]|jgi:predicted regulator of Ras-like GTPase activity (Roadblock/LC7/MglB family)|nr:roadblock/LC7 domain-containing protein [Pseudonocardiaceae bacterium]
MATPNAKQLDWLLDDLINRLVGAEMAVVLSKDGLPIGRSASVSRDSAEHVAAMASALQSLASGAGRHFEKGTVRQTVVELDRAFLIVTAAGAGAHLALLAAEDADMALIAYEMNVLVQQVGASLVAAPRKDLTHELRLEQPRR